MHNTTFLSAQKLLGGVILACLLLGLAGCGAMPQPPTATPTPLPPTTTPTQTPIPTPTNTPFVPKATFNIVVHVPLTGGSAEFGNQIANAAELAVQQQGGGLELLGYKVELIRYDDQGDIDTGVANAKEIVANPNILCGVGHFFSRITLPASEVYHQAGLAFISPSSTNVDVTERGYLEVNRVVGRDDGQSAAGAQFVQSLGLTKVFIFSDGDGYGANLARYFKAEAAKLGLVIVGEATINTPDAFGPVAQQAISQNAEIIYLSTAALDMAGGFIKQARENGYTGAFLGNEAWDNPALAEFAGPFAMDGGGVYYTLTVGQAKLYPNTSRFVEDFRSAYGVDPMLFTAQAYDAASICMKAIEEASKAKGGEIPTRAEVANAIRALVDYQGITNTYTFTENGNPTSVRYFVYKLATSDPGQWDKNELNAFLDVPPPTP